jgi:hypothetical protein
MCKDPILKMKGSPTFLKMGSLYLQKVFRDDFYLANYKWLLLWYGSPFNKFNRSYIKLSIMGHRSQCEKRSAMLAPMLIV